MFYFLEDINYANYADDYTISEDKNTGFIVNNLEQ